jgi:uncharacterized damage-inducible protein DinB
MPPPDVVALVDYLYWIRDRTLGAAGRLGRDAFLDPRHVVYRDLRGTLVHELDVERSWRLRLQGAPRDDWDVTLDPTDYADVDTLVDHWRRDEGEMRAWLEELNDEELAAPNTANGLEGFALSTYLVHIVMHGVESLSAAAILLHNAGQSVGDVGYLDFIDEKGSSLP